MWPYICVNCRRTWHVYIILTPPSQLFILWAHCFYIAANNKCMRLELIITRVSFWIINLKITLKSCWNWVKTSNNICMYLFQPYSYKLCWLQYMEFPMQKTNLESSILNHTVAHFSSFMMTDHPKWPVAFPYTTTATLVFGAVSLCLHS